MKTCGINTNRELTENFLLTLASRIKDTQSVIVLVAEKNGQFTNHQANFDDVPWATVAGNLAAIQHDILVNKLVWTATAIDGGELPEEE